MQGLSRLQQAHPPKRGIQVSKSVDSFHLESDFRRLPIEEEATDSSDAQWDSRT